jgi:hypothetical protein
VPATRHNRRGAALAVVLVALVVVAGLGAGVALASRESQRTASDERARVRAEALAAGGLEAAIHPWDRRRNQLAPGAVDSVGAARLVRLDRTRFLVEATARVRAAVRTFSALVRLEPPDVRALGAVTTGAPLALLGDAVVDGRDAPPPGWTDCRTPRSDTADVATTSDPTVFDHFAPDDWSTLAARADACAWDACNTPWPLLHASAGLTLGNTTARGVLLVDGDLVLDGTVTFEGVVVVRGALRGDAGALRLHGALLVRGGGTLGAGSRVRFSRCAAERALDGIARVAGPRRRSWAEVTP